MEKNLTKKYSIRISSDIKVFYTKDNIITFVGPIGIQSVILKTKVLIFKDSYIIITKLASNTEYKNKKFLKSFQKFFLRLFKQIINEISKKSKKKLKLVGVGFRATLIEKFSLKILELKLGYSHQIFINIPTNLSVVCPKGNKILIIGNCQQTVNKLSTLIRFYRIPDSYKGKGVLYENEKIILKEGKKI